MFTFAFLEGGGGHSTPPPTHRTPMRTLQVSFGGGGWCLLPEYYFQHLPEIQSFCPIIFFWPSIVPPLPKNSLLGGRNPITPPPPALFGYERILCIFYVEDWRGVCVGHSDTGTDSRRFLLRPHPHPSSRRLARRQIRRQVGDGYRHLGI